MMNNLLEELKNAFRRPNNAMIQLIIINVIVFLVIGIINVFSTYGGNPNGGDFVAKYLLLSDNPGTFITRPWTLITYAFNHAGLWHLFWNMIFLYWFGKLIMEYLGSQKLVNLYILGGITGGFAFLIMYNLLPIFAGQNAVLIGASGAVYAIVVAAATLIPNYTFYLLFLGPVRIKYIALFFVVLSFLGTAEGNAGGNFAHLGGAFIGFLYIRQLQKGTDIGNWIYQINSFFKSFFVRQPKIKVTHKSEPKNKRKESSRKRSRTEQEEIDAILDKISESGYESLTKEEKQRLFEASKKN